MWSNESPEKLAEAGYCKKVNRKYIFDPIKVENVKGLYPEVQKLYNEEFRNENSKFKGKGGRRIIKENIEVDNDNNIIIDNDNGNKIFMEKEGKNNLSGKKIIKGKKSEIEDDFEDNDKEKVYIEEEGKNHLSGNEKKYNIKSSQINNDEDIKDDSFSKGSFNKSSFVKDDKSKEGNLESENLEHENLEYSNISNEERKDEKERKGSCEVKSRKGKH